MTSSSIRSLTGVRSSAWHHSDFSKVEFARSTTLTSIDFSCVLEHTLIASLIRMPSLTHLGAQVDSIDVISRAFQSSSSLSARPSPLISLKLNVFQEVDTKEIAQTISTHFPHLRTLHLDNTVDLSAFQPMLCLEDLECSRCEPLSLPDFTNFTTRMPSLTRLDVPTYLLPESWGLALASSCPHLTSLKLRQYPYLNVSSVFSSDAQALSPLPLTTLSLGGLVYMSTLKAIGHLLTLRSLSLEKCDDVFQLNGARAISHLPALAKLELRHPSGSTFGNETAALELLLQSLHMLEELHLQISALTEDIALSLAHHPSLTRLSLTVDFLPASTALTTIITESKSVSSFTIALAFGGRLQNMSLEHLQRNVHLLDTNLFDWCHGIGSGECERMKYTRNRPLLHNWQCICVLLASYRANMHSPIRDSMVVADDRCGELLAG